MKKEIREPREFDAKFTKSRNDLYWRVCFYGDRENGYEWFSTIWIGYDDANWWNNVAPSKTRRTIVGDKGTSITLEIDFKKCKAKEVINL